MLSDILGEENAAALSLDLIDFYENVKRLGWKEIRPWGDFLGVLRLPQWNYKHIEQRAITNLYLYRSNYAIICLFVFVIKIIFSPSLFFVLVLCLSFSAFVIFIMKKPIEFGDIKLDGWAKVALCVTVSFLIMILTGALEQLLWGLVYAIFLCGLHMILRPRSVTSKANKMYEEVKLKGLSWFGGNDLDEADGSTADPENPISNSSDSLNTNSYATVRRRNAMPTPMREER